MRLMEGQWIAHPLTFIKSKVTERVWKIYRSMSSATFHQTYHGPSRADARPISRLSFDLKGKIFQISANFSLDKLFAFVYGPIQK